MMQNPAEAVQAYRKLAAELRERAADMIDPDNRTVMLSAANGYEHLAQMVENGEIGGASERVGPGE